jgi:polyisoprenoid-binding protein YceI
MKLLKHIKLEILIVIAVLIVVAFGLFALYMSSVVRQRNINEIEPNQVQIIQQEFDISKQSIEYTLSQNSKVTFNAKKRYTFGQEETVKGELVDVFGIIEDDFNNNEIDMRIQVSLVNLNTDNSIRDEAVKNLFNPPIAEVIVDNFEYQESTKSRIDSDGVFKVSYVIPATVIINEREQNVYLNAELEIYENTIYIEGNSDISLSKFGIQAPSIKNVYSVQDIINLEFEAVATKSI